MAEGHKVCCSRARRRRFCIAAIIAVVVMVMSMPIIVAISKSQPIEGSTLDYLFYDFVVVIALLTMFGIVDHYCCLFEKPLQKEKKARESCMTKFEAANSGFADDHPVVFFSSADATSSGDATFSADTSCSVDVSYSADASCSADTSCD